MTTVRRPDGAEISYEVEGEGPAVVFVHGLTSSGQAWKPVTDLLVRDFTCVRVDLRGHGSSSTGPEYSTPSLVGDLRAVAEDLELDEHALVGHSLGVTVAAVYAAAHGASAVLCVDSTLRFGDFAAFVAPWAQALRGEGTMQAVLEIDHALQLAPYDAIEAMEQRILAFPREVVLGIWDTLLTTPPEQLTAIAETVLPQIKAPLLSLHGTPPPRDYEAWLTGLVPRARVEVWDGAGHMLHLVDPERFVARIRPMLSGSPTA